MVNVKAWFDDGIWWVINSSYLIIGYAVPFIALTLWGNVWFSDLHHLGLWFFGTSFIAGGLLLVNSCLQKGSIVKVFSGLLLCVIGCLYML